MVRKMAKARKIRKKEEVSFEQSFFMALDALEGESHIDKETLIEKIRSGIEKAIKKDYFPFNSKEKDKDKENDLSNYMKILIDPETNRFELSLYKEVMDVMFVDDPEKEIFLDEARTYDPDVKVGDMVEIRLDPAKFGRVAAQSAKQSIKHDIKDFEKQKLVAQFKDKEHECVSATVQKVEPETLNAILTIDKNEVYLVRSEQIPGEVLTPGDIIKVYIVNIVNPDTRPSIKISRTHRDLVKRLFELEVPEIADGTVQVKAISRVAGARSKMAVYSEDKNVDAVGACIGPRKSRISSVVNELKGEKIDIITWVEDKAEFIAKALAPATVLDVETGEDNGTKVCRVTVPDDQLSLAIGNKGQNAKLAAGLTGYKIDIISDKDPKPEPLPQPAPKEELPDEPEEETDLLAEDGTEDTQE